MSASAYNLLPARILHGSWPSSASFRTLRELIPISSAASTPRMNGASSKARYCWRIRSTRGGPGSGILQPAGVLSPCSWLLRNIFRTVRLSSPYQTANSKSVKFLISMRSRDASCILPWTYLYLLVNRALTAAGNRVHDSPIPGVALSAHFQQRSVSCATSPLRSLFRP